MAKKMVKKKKLKVLPFLLVLVLLGGLFFGGYFYLQGTIQNIIVKNTSYLNDDYVIELADVKDYPSFYLLPIGKMTKKLSDSPYIENVKISRIFFRTLIIEIKENRPLFINHTDQNIVFEDKTTVPIKEEIDLFRVPRLINYVPDGKYEKFIQGMSHISDDILGKISDIEYQPNEYDKDRFLLYMDDGNMVYLTLTKFKMINYYNSMLSQLENRRGILYLDSGNHFQIKE